MGLKTKLVNIRGREIKVKQLSFVSRINLMKENTNIKLIQVSLSEEDFDYLNNLEVQDSDIEDTKNLFEAINEINGWNKTSDESQDFPEKSSESSS